MPLSAITNPRSKVLLEMCSSGIKPGHSGKGDISPNTPVMALFADGHVKMHLFDKDYDDSPANPDPEKPVYYYPNTTE